MPFTVASVPYVNAMPLVSWFDFLGEDAPVKVRYGVPSSLPALLESGEAQAILVSSIEALQHPGRRMAAGVCIGSVGAVESVRLFSRVPFSEIQTLALDRSSMTSNALAQTLLRELYGVTPSTLVRPSLPPENLTEADACVLIGDLGMSSKGQGMHILDLGEAWQRLTGLPFVWAAWIGGESLTSDLAGQLGHAMAWGQGEGWSHTVAMAQTHSGWPQETVERYLSAVIRYEMTPEMLQGLQEFRRRLESNGLLEQTWMPETVSAQEGAQGFRPA